METSIQTLVRHELQGVVLGLLRDRSLFIERGGLVQYEIWLA